MYMYTFNGFSVIILGKAGKRTARAVLYISIIIMEKETTAGIFKRVVGSIFVSLHLCFHCKDV